MAGLTAENNAKGSGGEMQAGNASDNKRTVGVYTAANGEGNPERNGEINRQQPGWSDATTSVRNGIVTRRQA